MASTERGCDFYISNQGRFFDKVTLKPLNIVREGFLQVSGRRALWGKGLRDSHASRFKLLEGGQCKRMMEERLQGGGHTVRTSYNLTVRMLPFWRVLSSRETGFQLDFKSLLQATVWGRNMMGNKFRDDCSYHDKR